jgi:hypothetical protein
MGLEVQIPKDIGQKVVSRDPAPCCPGGKRGCQTEKRSLLGGAGVPVSQRSSALLKFAHEEADSAGPVKWVVPAWEVLAADRRGWRAGLKGLKVNESEVGRRRCKQRYLLGGREYLSIEKSSYRWMPQGSSIRQSDRVPRVLRIFAS